MTNDPIEEFLDKAEKFDRGEFPSIDLSKLIALVRIYREANKFYADTSEQGYLQRQFVTYKDYEKAMQANQKALEIVK